jgi:hypothetical protein
MNQPSRSDLDTTPAAAQSRWPAWALTGFVAGFVSVIVFHQVAIASIGALFGAPVTPWSLAPVAPFGVPRVVSTAFWGGLWGIALALVAQRIRATAPALLLFGLIFGALLPSLVGWFVIAPIRGQPMFAGGNPARLAIGLTVNAVWGLGTAVLLWLALRSAWVRSAPR